MLKVILSIILRNRVCIHMLKADDQGCKMGILFRFDIIGRGHRPDVRVSSAIVTQGNRAIGPINSSDYVCQSVRVSHCVWISDPVKHNLRGLDDMK